MNKKSRQLALNNQKSFVEKSRSRQQLLDSVKETVQTHERKSSQ